jgi:vancomycin resistance protein VanW
MFAFQSVEKPILRGKWRRKFGREYFILKRKFHWLFSSVKYAKVDKNAHLPFSIKQHQSFLLRPLKDIDMYLQHNKVTNLRLAIAQMNQVVIHPGETFSLWRLVGRPTASKGYLPGLALHNGQISSDIGGGLCQLGNLLYWMLLHSPLTITERWRHGFDVFPDVNRTIPFACGATLAYNYIDLQFQNNTNNGYQIKLWLDDEYLHGDLLCSAPTSHQYEIFETDHQFRQQPWGGYTRHNSIWKRITDLQNNQITEELVSDNNAIMMYSPFLTGR